MWRGGSPPLGCEAAPDRQTRFIGQTAFAGFTTASQPNGAVRRFAKPPRHRFTGSCWIFVRIK
ncbi:hypothetical protein C9I49_23205 [Pseudomonas prosekii]|uniref:Uncharacterized protein n=1 Tax=Pseudomonas prosekii TaxID=1148509 RepID=A0A2U2D2I6_9PSED|nr:hypothetical protein C9I49_23205 [Pseudomonas prosekii]